MLSYTTPVTCFHTPIPRTIVRGGGRKGGGGVQKPQNRTEIRQKTANRNGFFPEYRSRRYSWRECGVTSLRNSHLRVIAAKEYLLEKYISKDLLLFHGTIGGSLNISLSNNPVLLRGGHFVRVEPLEVICKQSDADRSKECHHGRLFFHRKPRPKGCNYRKPLSVLKPQYRKLK